ncbi:MAG TPA: hypothetical protein ENK18_24660 [Deltaproteobacteria bacterium]|nr:hypothetical protein [Deltaproteobacteria bacterium]
MERTEIQISVHLDSFEARIWGMAPALVEPLLRALLSLVHVGVIVSLSLALGIPLVPVALFLAVVGVGIVAGVAVEMAWGTPCWTLLSVTQHRIGIEGERTPRRTLLLESVHDVMVSTNRLILCTDGGLLTIPTEGHHLEAVRGVARELRHLIALARSADPRQDVARAELLERLRRLSGAAGRAERGRGLSEDRAGNG